MGELSDFGRKNLRDGADIDKFEKLLDKYSIENITTVDKGLAFILDNDMLNRGLDKHTQSSIKNHDKTFMEDKYPAMLLEEKKKMEKDLTPPKKDGKSAEYLDLESKYAALEQSFNESQQKARGKELALLLTQKGASLGMTLDEADIDRYVSLGEKSLEYLEKDAERIKSLVDSGINSGIKERYGDNPQPQKKEPINPKSLDEQIHAARQAGNSELAGKLQIQKNQPQQ